MPTVTGLRSSLPEAKPHPPASNANKTGTTVPLCTQRIAVPLPPSDAHHRKHEGAHTSGESAK
ncbi:hypothetical protein GCM10010359_17990 [Streptomyces morookaense]|nr:hypothetical protein GCM10010359_17990 [Streptomyces morookaense]